MAVVALSRATGLKPSTLYDVENGHSSTSKYLHRIADALGLNVNWLERLDGPRLAVAGVSEPKAPYVLHGYQLTAEGAEFAQEWEKLEEPARSQIRVMVESLVAAQIRAARAKQKPKETIDEPTDTAIRVRGPGGRLRGAAKPGST